MTTNPAVRVFKDVELLENIILFLQQKSIIVARRTCRQFRDVVATSKKIQEKLKLLPSVSPNFPTARRRRLPRSLSVKRSTPTKALKQNPAAKVLAIPELLEAVLLELPPRDLLLSQRVNKTFRDVIDDSIYIQRKLFFKPCSSTVPDGTSVRNPFLQRILRLHDPGNHVFLASHTPRHGRLLRELSLSRDEHFCGARTKSPNQSVIDRVDHSRRTLVTELRNGSWQRMLVADTQRRIDIRVINLLYEVYGASRTSEIEVGSMCELVGQVMRAGEKFARFQAFNEVDWMQRKEREERRRQEEQKRVERERELEEMRSFWMKRRLPWYHTWQQVRASKRFAKRCI